MANERPPVISTEHGGIALTMARTLEACGCDSDAMFREAGIDPAAINSPEIRVNGEAMQRLWRSAVLATRNESLGLVFSENFLPGALHGLGFAFGTSDTLHNAFQRLVRYFRVICTVGEVVLEEDGDCLQLWLKLPVPAGIAVDASIDAALALFVQLCRFAKGPSFCADTVYLQRRHPADVASFDLFFRSPVVFESPENVLRFRRSELDKPLPMANPALARANDGVVIEYLREFDQENVVNQLRASIIDALPSGLPSREEIAKSLNMSQRSLQRRLADENTTFRMLEDIRSNLAKHYLSQAYRSVGEVSYLLGYSEPGNFARSFKQWTGKTPIQFRTAMTP